LLVKSPLPLARIGKRTLPFILPFLLVACGGAAKHPEPAAHTLVKGAGFQLAAPAGWKTKSTGTAVEARKDAAGRTQVSATAFTLLKPYTPALFGRAAKELDRVAAQLAAQSHSKLSESATVTVDGRRVRAYRLTVHPASGPSFDERIGFVLLGKHEYQLLCRAPVGSGDPDGACELLYASFKTSR
jgi:hypothetical protein